MGKTVTAPLSRITILFQVNALPIELSEVKVNPKVTKKTSSRSILSVMKHVVQKEGVTSLWRGNFTAILHRFPYSAINFSTYEHLKKVMCHTSGAVSASAQNAQRKDENAFKRFMAGAIAASISCIACYPLDLIKTRITVGGSIISAGGGCSNARPKAYGKIIEAFRDIFSGEGVLGLYRGLPVALFVSVPSLAISWTVYEAVKDSILNSSGIVGKVLTRSSNGVNSDNSSDGNFGDNSGSHSPNSSINSESNSSRGIQRNNVIAGRDSGNSCEGVQRGRRNSNNCSTSSSSSNSSNNSSSNSNSSINSSNNSNNINSNANKGSDGSSNNNNSSRRSLTPIGSLLSGSVSGIMSSLTMFPADLVRRRLQVMGMALGGNQPSSPGAVLRMGAVSMVIDIARSQGIRGFYRGLFPEIVKVAPMVGVTFCSYELVLEYCGNRP